MDRRVMLVMPPNDSDIENYRKPSWSLCRIPPIGLLSIGSYLLGEGHRASIVDCRELITRYPRYDYIESLLRLIKNYPPDVVGINMLTANFNHVSEIAFAVKLINPNIKIVAGGVHPSVEPDLTLKQIPSIDVVCIGAGEEVMLEVAEGQPFEYISGLKVRGREISLARKPEMDIDKYPFPDYRLVSKDWYTKFSTYTITGWGFRGISALTSRSCPYSCKFCASDWSKPARFHSAEYVIELAKHLAKMDIDVISFFDDTIALKEDRLVSICEGFIREKIFYPHTNLRWIGELRANQTNPARLKLMKRAGCFHIGMGIESGSDRMLKVVNKRVTVEENRQACRYIKEAGLHLGISFMMGIPTETEEDMRATLSFMKEINCNYMGIGTFRPLPGSAFFNELIKDKEDVDWVNLGNFMIPPKYKFYDTPERTFNKLYDEAYNYAYGRQWLALHKHTGQEMGLASQVRTKNCLGDNYYSDNHVANNSSMRLTLRNAAESFYMNMPYEIRRMIKSTVKKLTRVKVLNKMLWRYA